jgi:hypothetical protein
VASKRALSVAEKLAGEKDEEAVATRERLQTIIQHLRIASQNVWMNDDGLFSVRYGASLDPVPT